jgi:hypothetical protein
MARAEARRACQDEAVVSLGPDGELISVLSERGFISFFRGLIPRGQSLLAESKRTRFTRVCSRRFWPRPSILRPGHGKMMKRISDSGHWQSF